LPKIYIRPEVTHIETTTGGGQQDLKEHPGTDLSRLDVISHFGQNRFLTDIEAIFPKIASGQEVGMGQHGEGVMGMMV